MRQHMPARIEVYSSVLVKPFAYRAYTLSYNIVSFLLHVTHTSTSPNLSLSFVCVSVRLFGYM